MSRVASNVPTSRTGDSRRCSSGHSNIAPESRNTRTSGQFFSRKGEHGGNRAKTKMIASRRRSRLRASRPPFHGHARSPVARRLPPPPRRRPARRAPRGAADPRRLRLPRRCAGQRDHARQCAALATRCSRPVRTRRSTHRSCASAFPKARWATRKSATSTSARAASSTRITRGSTSRSATGSSRAIRCCSTPSKPRAPAMHAARARPAFARRRA